MRLTSIRIENYKGFADSGSIELGENWTVIVGRNNSGKSALLDALAVSQLSNRPHVNISQDPTYPRNPSSNFYYCLEAHGREIERAFLRHEIREAYLPVQPDLRNEASVLDVFREHAHSLEICRSGTSSWNAMRYPAHGLFQASPDGQNYCQVIRATSDKQRWQLTGLDRNNGDSIPSLAGVALADATYVFKAERRVSGNSAMQDHLTLSADASNLAGALHYLFTSNNPKFRTYFSLIQEVLPEVQAISIPPNGANVEIRVWNNGYEQGRDDLAIPLDQCGTGIGQVLAILFIAATAEPGRILVIDEPNSFLHPGASRVLIQVLKRFKEHQFIISTHSPELIAAADPEKLILMRWINDCSNATIHEGTELANVQATFDELGVKLSDVFGLDAVAWVEGKTEEKCFPLIVRAAGYEMVNRTAFVAVASADSISKLNANALWDAYKALASRNALAPVSVSISLDRERRTDATCGDLIRRSRGLVSFLPRATYENYLIYPDAIAAVLTAENPEKPIATEKVAQWMAQHSKDSKYFERAPELINGSKDPAVRIDAPRLLGDLIGDLTNYTQDYHGRKVQFGVALTSWILQNDRDRMAELTEYVLGLLARASNLGDAPVQRAEVQS